MIIDTRDTGGITFNKDALACNQNGQCAEGNIFIAQSNEGEQPGWRIISGSGNDDIILNDANNEVNAGAGLNRIVLGSGQNRIIVRQGKNTLLNFKPRRPGVQGDILVFKKTLIYNFAQLQECMQDLPGSCLIALKGPRGEPILVNIWGVRCNQIKPEHVVFEEDSEMSSDEPSTSTGRR